ncbi:hypothetical protein C4K00_1670 [Pseudomonas synxantha]|nr:hypothetical protein C4K00_1670 [Pseudomonas synxantha]
METGIAFMRHQPANFLRPLKWLLQGKKSFKQGLAQTVKWMSTFYLTTLPLL